MKVTDPHRQRQHQSRRSRDSSLTYTAKRVLMGHCPDCGNVVVVFNDYESWPLIACTCGWTGDTLSILNRRRLEEGWVCAA